jgi:hypothetical protein
MIGLRRMPSGIPPIGRFHVAVHRGSRSHLRALASDFRRNLMPLTKDAIHTSLATSNNPPDQRRRAARHIAGRASSAEECAELLDMLGLTAEDGLKPEK